MSGEVFDRDFRKLIDAAIIIVDYLDQGAPQVNGSLNHLQLKEALTPFRPDPEEELIEAMAKEFRKGYNGDSDRLWDNILPSLKEDYIRGVRAALAVIKEKGYFNDQR